jgi:hypothetical protein
MGIGHRSLRGRLIAEGTCIILELEVRGVVRTEDEDGNIMVLLTRAGVPFDLDAAISCEWRPSDVWYPHRTSTKRIVRCSGEARTGADGMPMPRLVPGVTSPERSRRRRWQETAERIPS